jgi:hypothetical protein
MGAVAPPLAQSWASRSDCLGALSCESGRLGAGLLTLADYREW